jgi:hypothetical protein
MLSQQLIAATLGSLLLGGGGGSGCRTGQTSEQRGDKPANATVENQKPPSVELKVLAEGSHSSITNPFIAVVRDTETYVALVKLDGNLPKLAEDFFKTNVLLAAFLGERNTAGYSVEITRIENGQIQIDEKVPAKDAMVAQVITSPFKLLSVPARGTRPLSLLLHGPWRQSLRPYRITSGDFAMSGGFAGTTKQFGLEGQVWLIHQDNFVTFSFEIFGHEVTERRSLVGFETAVIKSSGEITILRMTADSLVDSPNSGLKATVAFSEADNNLSLDFRSLPSMIADGYSGTGNIKARIIASAPKP